jgi:hypothetical protein
VNQETVEIIELVIADEIVSKPYGRYEKCSVEDTSKDEGIFERYALIVETAMRKVGKISFTGIPPE